MTEEDIKKIKTWYHTIEYAPNKFTPGINNTEGALKNLKLQNDLTGKTVLDIGAATGFYSFECERRGAKKVVALDAGNPELTGFNLVKQHFNSNVIYIQKDIYDYPFDEEFDIVLFLGILYHLQDPMLFLNKIRKICKETLYLETYICDDLIQCEKPIMHFYPGRSLNNDPTNWWGPNIVCLEAMLHETNFVPIYKNKIGKRISFICK